MMDNPAGDQVIVPKNSMGYGIVGGRLIATMPCGANEFNKGDIPERTRGHKS